MIFVGRLRPTGAPWSGGISARLLSDESRDELLAFAQSIDLQPSWVDREPYPHVEISPRMRVRALELLGARAGDRDAMGKAIARFRAAENRRSKQWHADLANGTGIYARTTPPKP